MHQHFAVPVFIKLCVIENSIAFPLLYIVTIYFGMNMRDAGIVCTAECRRAARHRRSGDAVTFG